MLKKPYLTTLLLLLNIKSVIFFLYFSNNEQKVPEFQKTTKQAMTNPDFKLMIIETFLNFLFKLKYS